MAEITYSYRAPPIPGMSGWVIRSSDEASIPCNLDNTDYQAFLAWLADGNPAPEGWSGPTNP